MKPEQKVPLRIADRDYELRYHNEAMLLTVEEVARRLCLKRSWVYAHAEELGAYRLGKYLRFDWNRVEQRLADGVIDRAN